MAATDVAMETGTLVSWEVGIGDDKKYSIAHVSQAGIILVPKMKDYRQWAGIVAAAEANPTEAAEILRQAPKAKTFAPNDLSKITYSKDLTQLSIFDREDKKTKVPDGKEQEQVFAAIQQHLGGTESEEDADAWSVMQTPLFVLSVIAVIGGFFIWFCSISDPNYEATGRRSGMKQLMNWVGYTIGPFWMSVAVGGLASIVLIMMISQLVNRPKRAILEYTA